MARAEESAGDPDLPAAMSPAEFSQLEAVVHTVAPARVVEWGSGGSTKAIPRRFSCIERYVSVEHNAQWHAKVRAKVDDARVVLELKPPADRDPEPEMFGTGKKISKQYIDWAQRCEDDPTILADYVACARDHFDALDLAFVDGRARIHCIAVAWDLLRPGGMLVVHDAQRDIYRAALEALGPAPRWLDPWHRGQLCLVRKPD